jgi:hypothetical protein
MAFELRTWSVTVAIVIMLAVGGSGCGGFVESGGEVQRLTVGAEGGTLATEGFVLLVPAHALGEPVTLSAQRAVTDSPAGPAFTVGPGHVTFDPTIPADVTLHYDAAVHAHPADVFAAILAADVWHVLARPAGDSGTAGIAHGVTPGVGTFGVVDCPGGVCP